MRYLIIFLATGAGAGFAPAAPGTAGSVVGLLIAWGFFAPLWNLTKPGAIATFIALFAVSCWIAQRAEEIFQEHDSSRIVLDEVLGMAATLFLMPLSWQLMLAGFVIFRLFDIIKPFPANLIDRRMRGGAGVMLDDLVAGVYANLVLRVLARLF